MSVARAVPAEVDLDITPETSWPIFPWLNEQLGNLMALGIVLMVGFLVWGVIVAAGGAADRDSSKKTRGMVMVLAAILGVIAIIAGPAVLKWATGQTPIG